MSKKATIGQIAKLTGLSTATVSRALNGVKPMKQETYDLVLDTAKALNYHGLGQVGKEVKSKSHTIGVLLPDFIGGFFVKFTSLISDQCGHHNFTPLFVSYDNSLKKLNKMALMFQEKSVDGLIMIVPDITYSFDLLLESLSIPIVSIYADAQGIPSITQDNFNGMKSLTNHFIKEHACHSFGFVRGPENNRDAEERFMGFKSALDDAGISFSDDLQFKGDYNSQSGDDAITYFHGKGLPEAVIFANDAMAVGGMNAAKRLKISVPFELKIGGYDNLYRKNSLPISLTSVHQPLSELSREAVKKIVAMIDHCDDLPQQVKVSGGVVLGRSCGCY